MLTIKFTSDIVKCSHGEWSAELKQSEVETVTESIDTETLIAELESRGYTVREGE